MNKKNIENVDKYISLYEKYGSLLTQNQSQVFQLYFYQDLSYAEVAEIMATTRAAAYDAVNKACSNLEKYEAKLKI
ncbi:hypothetical protein H9M94_01555 [Mycoplasma sp. Pen4]|uniref:sigma factor-like helix-turn-helix DNA-binding protein n=1 Tax=Mycoplasma sp. Pen4 TaxID=640330 RepID=UPI00165447E8|nr:sigma factor-like helix-turn-helix DNA-binding protein [Mycoplasma sp. Pen4]QNM93940.1 hypothetical protein H9M94_01555 [Mycoplasma sp. Pen4]